jgi:2-oxoglutarate dehydrogenase E2 component (dihydrolipoamide succinyltransferase)
MPQLGETVTEGTILRWLKKVGDEIAQDEPLFEVSTDKVDSEVPSPASGYVAEILVPEGATVDVGAKLAVITGAAPSGTAKTGAPSVATVETPSEAKAARSDRVPAAPSPTPPPRAPALVRIAEPAETEPSWKGLVLSPVVRQLVAEHGIDPDSVTGTGRGGRITRADVLSYIDRHVADSPAVQQAVAVPSTPSPVAGARDEVVPFTNIRRLTAEHMVRSKATSAHTLAVIEADYEGIERVRKAHRAQFLEEEGIGLTYLSFIARALVDALRAYPQLNASVGDDALIVHRDVHLGIAVDLDQRGLIVPVVRNAEGQSLRGLARAIADLADRARKRKLSADEVAGGTFTITNPGPSGTFLTAPIINQPQVAILSTDGIKRRPVVISGPDGTEAVGIHSVGMLALSFDHRAVDGAYASAFLHELAREIETRDWEAEF